MSDVARSSVHAPTAATKPLTLPQDATRVLLIHPPVYDIRLPWAQYSQPIGLLRLCTFFRARGAEVRLIDAMQPASGKPLRRELSTILAPDEQPVNKWRFGSSRASIERSCRTLVKSRWMPDVIYVECLTTFWWEGAQEVIRVAKTCFPDVPIVLFGGYAELASDHARSHTLADEIGKLNWADIASLAPDLSDYTNRPSCVYISLANGTREAGEVVEELSSLRATYNVQSFAFLDHAITTEHTAAFQAVLEEIIRQKQRVTLYALGSVPLADVIAHSDLLPLMKEANYQQVYFADDRDAPLTAAADQRLIELARQAAEISHRAGFRARTDAITASLCLGRPGEDLRARARTAVHVAHHLGSIIFWPYQPSPSELPEVALDEQNGKLFPFRERNSMQFTDYLSVLGLVSVLNAENRTRTFDFLGDSFIARLFRDSVQKGAWDPPAEVKGTLKLPVVKR